LVFGSIAFIKTVIYKNVFCIWLGWLKKNKRRSGL